MLLQEIKNIFHKELGPLYQKEEIDTFFHRSTTHFLGLERFALVLRPNLVVSKEEEQPLFETLTRLQNEEPLQYILGETEFMDCTITVNPDVLIPRPETEELVEWVVGHFEKNPSKIQLLDMGTGSGCIAIALSKLLPHATVTGLDISTEAIKMAEKNAVINQATVSFKEADMLHPELDLETKFDGIISNPPYVRELEKKQMANNVTKYEPAQALFVPDANPLVFYEAIAHFGQKHLKPNGNVFLEINQYLGERTKQLFVDKNFTKIELKKDIFGNDRMLSATWEG